MTKQEHLLKQYKQVTAEITQAEKARQVVRDFDDKALLLYLKKLRLFIETEMSLEKA